MNTRLNSPRGWHAPDIEHLCITDDQVQALLADADALLEGQAVAPPSAGANEQELAQEAALHADAVAAGVELPLMRLRACRTCRHSSSRPCCAAPEIDRGDERIYGYVLDDMNRRNPVSSCSAR